MELDHGCVRLDPYEDRWLLDVMAVNVSSSDASELMDDAVREGLRRRLEHYLAQVDIRERGEIGTFATTIPEQPFVQVVLVQAGIDIDGIK